MTFNEFIYAKVADEVLPIIGERLEKQAAEEGIELDKKALKAQIQRDLMLDINRLLHFFFDYLHAQMSIPKGRSELCHYNIENDTLVDILFIKLMTELSPT